MDYNTLFPEKQSQHAASRFTAAPIIELHTKELVV